MPLRENMPNITTNLIPWPSRRRRFAANLQALAQRDPIGAQLVQAAGGGLENFELHSTPDGNYFILDKTSATPIWLGGLANHKATENIWKFDRSKAPMPAHILFHGLGYGWLFRKVLSSTEHSFLNYSCSVYILENDPTALAMFFHMHDLQATILHPRTRWFIRPTGPEALAALHETLKAHLDWTIPEQIIRHPLRPTPEQLPIEQTLKDLLAKRSQQRNAHIAQATAYYTDKDATYWSQRFQSPPSATAGQNGGGLRVLGITSRYTTVLQYSMAELQSAAIAAGYDFQIAIEPDDHSTENPCSQMIADFKPDLIIMISRMRYEHPLLPRNVPFLCWDQDDLPCMRTPQATASMDALTFVAGHGAIHGSLQLHWPLRNCIFCHPTGMTRRYNPGVHALARPEFAADVSYLSHASGSPESLRDSMSAQWQNDPTALHIFNTACNEILIGAKSGKKYTPTDFHDVIQRITTSTGTPTNFPQQNLLINLTLLTDRVFRHETLNWVACWCESRNKRFRLWGNGWDQHPTLRKYAAGPAMPGEGAQQVFLATKLNLQIIETG
ncbi:MAG: hypothetical protein FWD53_12725, partial [Phycisphaerales bacterium]|nr:hypothetical protein [Phycisphaerales bacterium]